MVIETFGLTYRPQGLGFGYEVSLKREGGGKLTAFAAL